MRTGNLEQYLRNGLTEEVTSYTVTARINLQENVAISIDGVEHFVVQNNAVVPVGEQIDLAALTEWSDRHPEFTELGTEQMTKVFFSLSPDERLL